MSVLQTKFQNSSTARDFSETPVLRAIYRYGLSFVLVVLASGATYLLSLLSPDDRPTLFMYFATIVIVAWYAGTGPGWLSVVLSAAAADYFLSYNEFAWDLGVKHIPVLVGFVICAAATNQLSLKRRRMEAELVQARDDLEARVRERTLDLQQANERLTEET